MRSKRSLLGLVSMCAALALPVGAEAAIYTVNTSADSNGVCAVVCSLREAIVASNVDAIPDVILFSISPGGAQTISPTSQLPGVTQPVTIDGTSQTGFAGTPLIELDGSSAGAGANGLLVSSSSTVRGLVINRFGQAGIQLFDGSRVEGSFIGTDPSGTIDRGNYWYGIFVGGTGNIVGGTTAAARNVISGNDSPGIELSGSGNLVQGNYIGTTASGTAGLGNCSAGIDVEGANNTIGGTSASAGNVISGNPGACAASGSEIEFRTSASGNLVQGNYIGTDPSGATTVGGSVGVQLGRVYDGFSGPANNTIGGSASGAGNVIARGVTFQGAGAGNVVRGNYIGTNAAGASFTGFGVQVYQATNTTIGGAGDSDGNVIRGSNAAGVLVYSGSNGTKILRNSISANTELGIDLLPPGDSPRGVTANDTGDADTGANGLQNYPVLASASTDGSTTNVTGSLNSEPNTTYRIDYYVSAACDASGYGESERWRGSAVLTTDGSGNVSINAGTGLATTAGEYVTATATHPSGNTSEFSACRQITGDGGTSTFTVNSANDASDGACTAAHCSLREAITSANATAGTQTISFAIGTGAATIQPTSQLPTVTDPVVIDGTTQPGFAGAPLIELDGTLAGTVNGLDISAGSSTVKGLVVNRFGTSGGGTGRGIVLRTTGGNVVQGNYLGTDLSGTLDRGNGSDGIFVQSAGNLVGGTTPAARNVVSGNGGHGIFLNGATSTTVQGNYVGTNAAGTAAVANGIDGVAVDGGANNLIGGTASGAGNLTSGNSNQGIALFGVDSPSGTTGNIIQGNRIGTNAAALAAIPNGGQGVLMSKAVSTTVGGDTAAARNVISGNGGNGVLIEGSISTGNVVRGNYIGATGSGDGGLGNGANGVLVSGSGSNSIGGAGGGQANVIVSHTSGAGVRLFGANGNFVKGNLIGVGADGSTPASNDIGVWIDGSDGNLVGRGVEEPNAGNLIAGSDDANVLIHNDADNNRIVGNRIEGSRFAGVSVHTNSDNNTIGPGNTITNNGSSATGVHIASLPNRVTQNSIHDNVGLGIDVASAGVTPNGTAGVQEFPVLTSLAAGGEGGSTVRGTLSSRASSDYTIEFFSSSECDPSGNGEGETFLGSVFVDTDASGAKSFAADVPEVGPDDVVTATATRVGVEVEPNTSEFSACLTGAAAASALTLTSDRAQTPAGARLVPLSAVPSSFLPVFSGRPAPVDSIPVDSIPVDSIPVDSIPVDSIPVDSIPVDSIPVDSIGLEAVPQAGLEQVLLSSLPLDWGSILADTPLAERPLQTLTLADLRGNTVAWARFEAISFADSGLAQSILRKLPTAALLLGKAPLAQLLPNGPTWCAQLPQCTSTSTVAGLAIVGAPVDSIPVGSTPVDSIPVDSIPVDSIPVDSIDLAASRIGGILIRTLTSPNTVVDCSRISCSANSNATLANAAALNPSAIRPGARLSHLAGALGETTINDVILGMLPRAALDWEALPIDGLQRFAPTAAPLNYRLTFGLDCARSAGLQVTVKLPTGSLVLPGTSRFAYGLGPLLAAANPATTGETGATWTSLPGTLCPAAVATQTVRLDFQALPGFRLGEDTASVSVSAGGSVSRADEQAPVLVTQNWEPNDEAAGVQTVALDQLVIGHVAASGDRELFRVPVPATRGTRTTFYLSHIAAGADFDLAIEQPPVASLLSNPVDSIPVDSIPVEDTGSSVAGEAAVIPPETLQDIPVDSIKVGSISANRGNADEVAAVVAQGEPGFYTIVVSGYNGSHSDDPFVLRVRQTPPPALPPCPARSFPNPAGTRGVLPGSLPASTRTLFLLNRERMNRLHGSAAVNALRAALVSPALLGRPEVAGALVEVDGDAAVRAAYAAWDASPCSVEAANAGVRAINAVVARFRPSLPNLRNVVLLGTDEALPMARILDPTTISPESDNAAALRFTTAGLTRGNALYAAAATSHFLSDAPYGSTVTIPWLNRQLYLPQLAVGRLVETPVDIQRQLELYVTANGLLAPDTALTTGYDFLTDGGRAVKGELDNVVGAPASSGLISEAWDAAQLRNAFTGKSPADDILSVNAHYDHWRLQPAAGSELITTAGLPALPADPAVEPAFARRIAFTMGCHGGLNIPNSLLATPLPPQALDWVEGYARQRSAVYVANTGFGYGDTISNALSERLMSLLAARLDEQGPIGELWVKALADYHLGAGAYGVYDEKVLQEATFYGLPFWRIGSGIAPTPPTPPGLANDPVSGLSVAQLTVTPSLDEHSTARGRFWEDGGKTLDVHYRPIQPRREVDVTVPGQSAKGVIIRSLVTNDVAGVDPATSLPTIDLSAHEPERDFRDTVFPANLVNLTTARRLGELQQRLVLNAGQFRPSDPVGPAGVERLVLSIGVEVAYSSSPDTAAPQIRFVGSTFSAGQATILVEVAEPVRRVAALYNDTTQWRFAELVRVGTSNTWTATVTAAQQIEVAAMAQDAAGNVGYSTNKGFNFISVTDTAGPEVLLEAPAAGAVYQLGQRVLASYACSDAAGVASCTGTVPSGQPIDTSTLGEHVFVITAQDAGGRETRVERRYGVAYPFDGFLPPVKSMPALNVVGVDVIPVKFSLGGDRGLDILAAGYPKSQAIPCDSAALLEGDTPTVATGGGLKLTGGRYHYNWAPAAAWVGSCRQFVLKLRDGTTHRANFRFVAG